MMDDFQRKMLEEVYSELIRYPYGLDYYNQSVSASKLLNVLHREEYLRHQEEAKKKNGGWKPASERPSEATNCILKIKGNYSPVLGVYYPVNDVFCISVKGDGSYAVDVTHYLPFVMPEES